MKIKKDRLLLFFDTEFTDFKEMDLISIGIVSKDGHEFYAENTEFNKAWCSEFVNSVVIPRLEGGHSSMSTFKLRTTLQIWIDKLLSEYKSVLFIYDYSGDWKLFNEFLVGFMSMEKVEGKQVNFDVNVDQYFATDHSSQHHALNDAKALLNDFELRCWSSEGYGG